MLTLPWALVEHLGIVTVPAVLLTSWAFFGILEIGLMIEDPFQGVLRLEVAANTLESDVIETVRFLGADDLLRLLLQASASSKQEKAQHLEPADASSSAPSAAFGKGTAKSAAQQRSRSPEIADPADAADCVLASIKCDGEGKGVISLDELRSALQELDPSRWTDERVEQVMELADADSDGNVSVEEWNQLMSSARDLLKVTQMPSSKPLPADSEDDDVTEQVEGKQQDEEEEEEEEEDGDVPEESEVGAFAAERQGEVAAP
eukprot:UN2328